MTLPAKIFLPDFNIEFDETSQSKRHFILDTMMARRDPVLSLGIDLSTHRLKVSVNLAK